MDLGVTLLHGDCLDLMADVAPDSVDTILTDPPYGLSFMGKGWDHGIPGVEFWTAALRVSKPGAMLMAFGGTRTYHRLACAIEDAGWEIRDCLMWLYGSGFPKSLDIGKAIDKRPGVTMHGEFKKDLVAARERHGLSRKQVSEAVVGSASGACWNWEHHQFPESRHWPKLKAALPSLSDRWAGVLAEAEREVVGRSTNQVGVGWAENGQAGYKSEFDITKSETDAAKQWDGWGTALKPAWEPIIVAMKPCDGTFAENAQRHGVAGMWIDGARIPCDPIRTTRNIALGSSSGGIYGVADKPGVFESHAAGRWPANVILDEEAGAMLDEQTGECGASGQSTGARRGQGEIIRHSGTQIDPPFYGDSGGASRFFYCAKASKSERGADNKHPTVKPLALMRYLARLTKTPAGGVVLDPFMGSGTTGVACVKEGRAFIGMEKEAESFATAQRRIAEAQAKQSELLDFKGAIANAA